MRKCDACGKTYVDSKDVFCPHCGAVGQKRCTHGSSFDSSRWDRGEIYRDSTNAYKYGAEPHAQREESTHNTQQTKKSTVEKQFKGDYKTSKNVIQTILETATKKVNENSKDEKKIVKIISIIVAIVSAISILPEFFSEIDSGFDDVVDGIYEEESVDYDENTVWYPVDVVAGDVYIEPFEDWDGTWFFDMYIESLYMSSGEYDMSIQVCDKLSGDNYVYIDGVFCTMPDKIMTLDNYNELINDEGCYIISDAQSTDAHTVQYWFNEGDIVSCSYISFNFDDGSGVKVTLPFDAFSCDEDGSVTYYTCNINETDGVVTFVETNPSAVIDEFDCMVEF